MRRMKPGPARRVSNASPSPSPLLTPKSSAMSASGLLTREEPLVQRADIRSGQAGAEERVVDAHFPVQVNLPTGVCDGFRRAGIADEPYHVTSLYVCAGDDIIWYPAEVAVPGDDAVPVIYPDLPATELVERLSIRIALGLGARQDRVQLIKGHVHESMVRPDNLAGLHRQCRGVRGNIRAVVAAVEINALVDAGAVLARSVGHEVIAARKARTRDGVGESGEPRVGGRSRGGYGGNRRKGSIR